MKLNLKYFSLNNSKEENKRIYRELSERWHPDKPGGNTKVMQEINAEYDNVKKIESEPFTKEFFTSEKNKSEVDSLFSLLSKIPPEQKIRLVQIGFYTIFPNATPAAWRIIKEILADEFAS